MLVEKNGIEPVDLTFLAAISMSVKGTRAVLMSTINVRFPQIVQSRDSFRGQVLNMLVDDAGILDSRHTASRPMTRSCCRLTKVGDRVDWWTRPS